MTIMRMVLSSEVQDAMAAGAAIVALESNVISSGLPYPENIATAYKVEQAIRDAGAVPATIAVLDGQMRIGLTADEIEYLGTAPGMRKMSRRDLPLALAQAWSGGTTVAATMFLAHRAGIPVFATGGIGGVHRGQPFDISADLPELAQTPVMVVCSGAKAILDLPLTLEWLETHGVPVIGFGTSEFPSFYSRHSGLRVDARVDRPEEAAHAFRAQRALAMSAGLLVTVPVPADVELDRVRMEEAISVALTEATAAGISGKALTPSSSLA